MKWTLGLELQPVFTNLMKLAKGVGKAKHVRALWETFAFWETCGFLCSDSCSMANAELPQHMNNQARKASCGSSAAPFPAACNSSGLVNGSL